MAEAVVVSDAAVATGSLEEAADSAVYSFSSQLLRAVYLRKDSRGKSPMPGLAMSMLSTGMVAAETMEAMAARMKKEARMMIVRWVGVGSEDELNETEEAVDRMTVVEGSPCSPFIL